ncbi:MAG: Hint domain-containing protein [Pseudomonadota bacterium]
MVAGVELTYDTGASALEMAQAIFGDGVTVTGASYTGDNRASAIYSNGDTVSPNVVPSDTGVILSTGQATAFTSVNASQSNLNTNTTTASNGPNNNADFNALAGANTFDASFLEIDFTVPDGVTAVSLNFVFASEEFPEFSGSIYNDVIGVWIDGDPVPLSVGSGDVNVTNISPVGISNVYVDNTGDQANTEMDGFTITMSLTIPVRDDDVNSIKIGVADVADSNFDSNLLIGADAIQSTLVALDDTGGTIFPDGTRTIDLLDNDINNTLGTLRITHINGQTVVANVPIILPQGQTITLNEDGTVTIIADSDVEEIAFTYDVASTTGETDTAFVTLTTIPCFTAGTRLSTPDGPCPVERLRPGDLVLTRDDGPQPVRWIGQRRVRARGDLAPIRIHAGALGGHGRLLVSPQHRVMVQGYRAALLFGEDEVLVAAKDLLDGRSIERVEGGWVEYVHVLFDRHQIVVSEGLETESFLPGSQTSALFDEDIIAEICAIFPELDPKTGAGYSPAARRTLRSYEAGLLRVEAA